MSDNLSTLSSVDISEFNKLEAEVIDGMSKMDEQWQQIARKVQAIKARELWRAKYKTYTEFLDKLGEAVGRKRRIIYDWLRQQEVKMKVVQELHKTSPNLSKIAVNLKPAAIVALSKEPSEKRREVFEAAAKQSSGQPPTASAISAAAKVKSEGRKATDKSTWPKDCTGHPIPPPAWSFWERRDEIQQHMNQISETKCSIERAKAAGDSLYSFIGTPAIDMLHNAYTTISNAKPHAVCTKCEGWWDRMTGGGCSTCHNTGLISKHQYEVCSPKEIKTMREKQNRARV